MSHHHYLAIGASYGEVYPKIICEAPAGAPCRMRPVDESIESWFPGDGVELAPANDCWIAEWISACGWDDAVRTEGAWTDREIFRTPIAVHYDEGVIVTPVTETGVPR